MESGGGGRGRSSLEKDDSYHLISSDKFSLARILRGRTSDETLCGVSGKPAIYLFDHDSGSRHYETWRPLCPHCGSIARSRDGGCYRTDGRIGALSAESGSALQAFERFSEQE